MGVGGIVFDGRPNAEMLFGMVSFINYCMFFNNSARTNPAQVMHLKTALVQMVGTTFVAGDAMAYRRDSDHGTRRLYIESDNEISYGYCLPGFGPGLIEQDVEMTDDLLSFTGCPFRCAAGTFGPGGNANELRQNFSCIGCQVGCQTCDPGGVCPDVGMSAKIDCSSGHCESHDTHPVPLLCKSTSLVTCGGTSGCQTTQAKAAKKATRRAALAVCVRGARTDLSPTFVM